MRSHARSAMAGPARPAVHRRRRRDPPPAAPVCGRLPEARAPASLMQRLAEHELPRLRSTRAGGVPPSRAGRASRPPTPCRSRSRRCRSRCTRDELRQPALHRRCAEAAGAGRRMRLAAPRDDALDADDDIDAVDAVDAELFPIFEEEGRGTAAAAAVAHCATGRAGPAEPTAAPRPACARCTRFKGGARLAGAMRLGEMAHRLETRDRAPAGATADARRADVEALLAPCRCAVSSAFEALRTPSRRDADGAVRGRSRRAADAGASRRRAGAGAEPLSRRRAEPLAVAGAGCGSPPPCAGRGGRRPAAPARRSTGPASTAGGSRCRAGGRERRSPARPRCACARRCSTGWSTRPARSASRARASKPMSARSRARWAT